MAVSMTDKLRLEVPVITEGTAPVLAQADAVLVRALNAVEVECLPENIPQHLVADISALHTVADSIYVRDLVVTEGVRIMTEPDHVVFSVTLSRAAEAEEVEEEVSADEVEVVGRGKKEEEEE
jgi:large subunit ribosomal protein L25